MILLAFGCHFGIIFDTFSASISVSIFASIFGPILVPKWLPKSADTGRCRGVVEKRGQDQGQPWRACPSPPSRQHPVESKSVQNRYKIDAKIGIIFGMPFLINFWRFLADFGSHFGSISASFWHHFCITFSSFISASFFSHFFNFLEPAKRKRPCFSNEKTRFFRKPELQ